MFFRNTLSANDNYPVEDCENLPSPVQMSLSLKRNFFSDLFVPFLETPSNFKHFEKKMILIATLFGKLDTVKGFVRPLFKKHRFRNPFDSQHIKGSQTIVKSGSEQFYQIFSIL